jgi:alcohol dehydrogenase (NADP+)
MLDFAARHRIQPWIESFEMTSEEVASAFERLEKGQMKYCGVLVRPEA